MRVLIITLLCVWFEYFLFFKTHTICEIKEIKESQCKAVIGNNGGLQTMLRYNFIIEGDKTAFYNCPVSSDLLCLQCNPGININSKYFCSTYNQDKYRIIGIKEMTLYFIGALIFIFVINILI